MSNFSVPPKDQHPALVGNNSVSSYHSSNPGSLNQGYIPQQVPFKEERKYSPEKINCLVKGGFMQYLQSNYNCKIEGNTNKVTITTMHQNINEIISELEQKINSLPFEGRVLWEYLDNTGRYIKYDEAICDMIESAYRASYLIISNENYEEYSVSIEFDHYNTPYNCHFGKPGRPHYQKRVVSGSNNIQPTREYLDAKDVEEYKFDHLTIRAIRRNSQNEQEKDDQRLDYSWKWKDDDKVFKPYTYESNYIIEYGYKNYLKNPNENQFIIIQGSNITAYQLVFSEMNQYNEKSRFKRKIRRDQVN